MNKETEGKLLRVYISEKVKYLITVQDVKMTLFAGNDDHD